MDIRAQITTVWLRRWWVVVGALLVGLAVFGVTSFVTPTYSAGLTARVVQTGGGDSSPQAEAASYFAETVAGLANTSATLDDIVVRSGLPLTRDEVAELIAVTPSSTPGFLSIVAQGDSPRAAAGLADATAAALAARVTRDNAAALASGVGPLREQLAQANRQLTTLPPDAPERALLAQQANGVVDAITRLETSQAAQLLLGSPATVPDVPESPTPRRDAALGFLVGLVVLAEGVVVWRAARGRLTEQDAGRAVEDLTGVPTVELRSRETTTAVLVPLLGEHLASADVVTVVQLGDRRDLDVGRELQAAAALVPASDAAVRTRVQTVHGERIDQGVLDAVRRQGGATVLAVDTARTSRSDLTTGLAALAAVGADVRGIAVWRGRFPREHGTGVPLPPDGPNPRRSDEPPAGTHGAAAVRERTEPGDDRRNGAVRSTPTSPSTQV